MTCIQVLWLMTGGKYSLPFISSLYRGISNRYYDNFPRLSYQMMPLEISKTTANWSIKKGGIDRDHSKNWYSESSEWDLAMKMSLAMRIISYIAVIYCFVSCGGVACISLGSDESPDKIKVKGTVDCVRSSITRIKRGCDSFINSRMVRTVLAWYFIILFYILFVSYFCIACDNL